MIKTLAKELLSKDTHELGSLTIGGYREGGIIRPFQTLTEGKGRVAKQELENSFFTDTLIFRSVNVGVQMITAAGFRMQYNSEEEKKIFTDFFDGLGQIGEDCIWEEIYEYNVWAQMVFGAGWNELVPDEDDEEIVDINRLNPIVMDYARNVNHEIILDSNQKPIGYVQSIPKYLSREQKQNLGDEIPEEFKKEFDLGNDKIFLLPERIGLIKLYTGGDNLEFWGLIEPAHKDTIRKARIEEAGTNSAFQRWMAPLIAYVGDQTHPPTPQLAKETLENMRKMKHDLLSTYPYYVKLDTVKGNEMESYIEMLKSLRENQAASLQMPMPFATGSGETTNRATLNNQQALLEFSLNDIAKKTALSITKRILRPVAESKGLSTWPKLVPNRVKVDELDDRAIRFSMYVREGIFSPEEVRGIIAETEGIELIKTPEQKPKEPPQNLKPEKPQDQGDSEEDKEESLYNQPYEEPWKEKTI